MKYLTDEENDELKTIHKLLGDNDSHEILDQVFPKKQRGWNYYYYGGWTNDYYMRVKNYAFRMWIKYNIITNSTLLKRVDADNFKCNLEFAYLGGFDKEANKLLASQTQIGLMTKELDSEDFVNQLSDEKLAQIQDIYQKKFALLNRELLKLNQANYFKALGILSQPEYMHVLPKKLRQEQANKIAEQILQFDDKEKDEI